MMDVSLEAKTKPLATLSAFSYIPPRRSEPKELSYFNKERKVTLRNSETFYNRLGYDIRLPRDNKNHWKGRGLDINKERSRALPVLSSSEYGHRPPAPAFCITERQYARVACIKSEIYMKNGILWNVEEGYGSVIPN
uniref:Cilia and flagella associated protein 90 n=1 Tax=Amphilophus citrinellus TaxID=61819 RepID=A0A3Q0S5T6_AMPCI